MVIRRHIAWDVYPLGKYRATISLSSFGFLSSAQETMTIVHIVLFEFKPTVHHEVVQDVSLYSISCAGCRAAGFEHPILFCAFIQCPSKNPLKREYEADANRPCFTGLQAYASPTTELHPPHVEAAVHHRVHRGSGPLPRRPSSCQTPARPRLGQRLTF